MRVHASTPVNRIDIYDIISVFKNQRKYRNLHIDEY